MRWSYRGKRLFDLGCLAVLALPAVIVGGLCAAAVRASSGPPVVFRQERVGRAGRRFTLLKFRTMKTGDNPLLPDPSRVTSVGRLLRRFSLDELPQLLNVLRGDMSIVGPRPTLAYQVERYTERQRGRLSVRPGLTGLAQVSGRNAVNWGERIERDLDYVGRQSAWLDVTILARTVRVVLGGEGVQGHPVDDPLGLQEP